MTEPRTRRKDAVTSPYIHALRQALQQHGKPALFTFAIGTLEGELRATDDSVWCILRRPGAGGLAIRAAYLPVPFTVADVSAGDGCAVQVDLASDLGRHRIELCCEETELERLRLRTTLTPAAPLRLGYMPADLYPFDNQGDPMRSKGRVEAKQRGLNAGLVYLTMDKPAFGNVFYFQNLTALNRYFQATGTRPDEVVGGEWPELGLRLPVTASDGKPTEGVLAAGEDYVLSDAVLVLRRFAAADEAASARHFLQMLGAAYAMIDRPATEYHDWIGRAEHTLRDLKTAPEATIRHYGHPYVHPYTGAEYPDSMVQTSVVAALHEWGKWRGEPEPFEAELEAGLSRFFDRDLGTIRRYLPNVGDDKDADAVDSWYLYHPMLNLAHMARDGDARARRLLLETLEFGIKAAHHFKYKWPVQYKITDFTVITDVAPADGQGQTDVGGIYAYVMLQAFLLTDDKRYVDEARAALDAAKGLRFNLNYQANLTAWGAAACMRMWRIANDRSYLDLAYVYLASFFHNSVIWESELGHAQHYSVFMGVTCLQDAPYMALYECFDSYAAFERVLMEGGPDLEPAARTLVSEYCKYALTRAWYYYPDALPPEAIAPEQRENNGHVDRKLSFPLEDLYPDGQPAGQVGQEVYGAGAAFVFASRAYHRIDGLPFDLFCNHFVRAIERTGERALSISIVGGEIGMAELSLIRRARYDLPEASLKTVSGEEIGPALRDADRVAFCIPAEARLVLTWR